MASSTNIVVVDDLEQPQLKQQQQPPQQLPEVLTTSKSAGKIYEAPSKFLSKGGPVEERLYKKTSHYSKFEFSLPKTES